MVVIREAGNFLARLCELNPWESQGVIQFELGRLRSGSISVSPSARPRDVIGQPGREVEGDRVLLPLFWFCPDLQWVRLCLTHRRWSTEIQMPTSVKTLTDTSSSSVSSGDPGSFMLRRKVHLTGYCLKRVCEVLLLQQESLLLLVCMCSALTSVLLPLLVCQL